METVKVNNFVYYYYFNYGSVNSQNSFGHYFGPIELLVIKKHTTYRMEAGKNENNYTSFVRK